MRRVRLPIGFAIAASALAASCSLLVQFHDQASCDGGLCTDDASVGDAAPGPDGAGDAPADGGARDARADRYAPCSRLANGWYCGNNGLNGYAGSPDDLVHCSDGGVYQVTGCDGGCLHVVDPFPDACNPCVGVANGSYCGRDLPGFPAVNADILIQCQGGTVSSQIACAKGCGSNGNMSACR